MPRRQTRPDVPPPVVPPPQADRTIQDPVPKYWPEIIHDHLTGQRIASKDMIKLPTKAIMYQRTMWVLLGELKGASI